MLGRTTVFRPAAVARYGTRREDATLPRLRPPRVFATASVFVLAFAIAGAALFLVSVPVHATAVVVESHASIVTLRPASAGPAMQRGQRVFVRRRVDGIVLGSGTIIAADQSIARARIEHKLPDLAPSTTEAIVETGSETLLHALQRRLMKGKTT